MSSVVFCPRCGEQRTGRICDKCRYDYIEGAKMPAVTLSRGVNPVSLVIGIIAVAVVAFIILGPMLASR